MTTNKVEMNAERWQKIKVILEEAIELSPPLRAAYLEKACAGDTHLRGEVEELLYFVEDASAENVLEQDVFSALKTGSFSNNPQRFIGERVGNYEIIEQIGAGGMGIVFLAQRSDGAFEQKVALKLIRHGMNSEAVLRRFFVERQILASLEHPNIARLIDGGTTDDGLPYLVMEYVEGDTILEYAARENLALDQRLSLFRKVCEAVSFAHQNLVIHRDLKPSNILINKDGEVKLLDFGIARILKNETDNLMTATQMRAFTPEYASPEQVRGEKLTTTSDVYSLGVILYELLTGSRPYKTDGLNISEIIKSICETEPKPPSAAVRDFGLPVSDSKKTASAITDSGTDPVESKTNPQSQISNPKSLRGDLDNIILKALRKEPERRYSSVEQFSEDIRRHQIGLPVSARKDTWNYRASKFLQRNKLAAAAALLILLSLVGGLAATLYQRNKAQKRFNDVRQLANSFLFEFHDAIENLPGATPARELVVKRAIEYLDKLAAEAEGDLTLQRELATAYERIGKIQGNSYFSNLGDTKGAMASYQKSLEIRQRLYQAEPTNRELQNELATAYEGVGDIFYTDNDLPNGLRNYDEALALRLPLVEAEPQDRDYLYALAELHTRRAMILGTEGYANLGDTLGALEEHERALAIAEKLVAIESSDEIQTFLAGDLHYLAMQQNAVGKSAEALANGRRAVAIQEALVARNPNNARMKESLMISLIILRYPLVDENLLDEAEKTVKHILAETEKAAAADPQNASARSILSISYNHVGRVLRESGKAREAITYHERALQTSEKLIAETTTDEYKSQAVQTRMFLAQAQVEAGDYSAALANLERCAEEYEKDLTESPENATTKDSLAIVYRNMGKSLAALKQTARAGEFFDRAVPFAEEAARKSPHNARLQTSLAVTYFENGKHWKQFADDENTRAKSCELLQKSFDVWDGLRQKGILSKFNQPRPDEVLRELSICR